jgi:hypothetical protein
MKNLKLLTLILVLFSVFIGCGKSQYAEQHQDSLIVKTLQSNNIKPEAVASKIAGVLNLEIAFGDIKYEDFTKFLDTWEARISTIQYSDIGYLINFYAKQLIQSKNDSGITKAVLITYYLFEGEISDMIGMNYDIGKPDAQVVMDLIKYLREHVHDMPTGSLQSYYFYNDNIRDNIKIAVEEAARKTKQELGMNFQSESEKIKWMQDHGFLLTDEEIRAITPNLYQ